MNLLSNDDECEVYNYFTRLGYRVTWGFEKTQCFFEIKEGRKILIQFDMYVRLDVIKADILSLVENGEFTKSNIEYTLNCEDDNVLVEIAARIKNNP